MKLGSFTTTVTQLIVEDMKVNKLLGGLAALGLDAESYRPQLSQVVFQMVGVQEGNKGQQLREWYFQQTEKVHQLKIDDVEKIYSLAGEVFLGLCFRPGSGKIRVPTANTEGDEL